MTAAAALLAAVALTLALPWRSRPALPGPRADADEVLVDRDRMQRSSPVLAALAGAGGWAFVGGSVGAVAAVLIGVAVHVVLQRAEPAVVRRRRAQQQRDLPHLVALLAAALRSGAAPAQALDLVAAALPGAAAERLGATSSRLRFGEDPAAVWSDLGADAVLGSLGRTLARSQRSGASVVGAVERLADELARDARARVEDRARAVGVKAALPLGLCLLPAFLLIGVVPLAAGLLRQIAP